MATFTLLEVPCGQSSVIVGENLSLREWTTVDGLREKLREFSGQRCRRVIDLPWNPLGSPPAPWPDRTRYAEPRECHRFEHVGPERERGGSPTAT
jgi:hypothetical protein